MFSQLERTLEKSCSCPSLLEKDTEVQSGSKAPPRGQSSKADLVMQGRVGLQGIAEISTKGVHQDLEDKGGKGSLPEGSAGSEVWEKV